VRCCLRQGILILPSRKQVLFALTLLARKTTLSQPTLPQSTFIHTHPACIYNVPDSNGQASKTKGIYNYVQMYTQDQRKGGKLQYPKNGDLTIDVLKPSSTYIKTLANKEKFQY